MERLFVLILRIENDFWSFEDCFTCVCFVVIREILLRPKVTPAVTPEVASQVTGAPAQILDHKRIAYFLHTQKRISLIKIDI